MSRRRNPHYTQLPDLLQQYADSRTLDFHRYSEYHMRIIDGGMAVLDAWTTAKYWVKETNYVDAAPGLLVERGGETGLLPTKKKPLFDFLDKLFFAVDLLEGES